ncbi:MAG: thymidylate synthase [Nanoarchaeota archaeon]|nr:thymidylate synthase [Nanoarchaeota archaeon]
MNLIHITARDLPEAWFLCLKDVMEQGREIPVDHGSYEKQMRRQLDFVTVHVKYPNTKPLLPDIPPGLGIPPPADEKYLESYLEYLITDLKKPNEDYTYGERLNSPKVKIKSGKNYKQYKFGVNQIEEVIRKYKEEGYSQNQCTMEIGMPSDISLNDPPCMRLIDTMIIEGKLNFYPYFRSWDLWGGFPANLAGLQLLKEYMAASIGVEDGEIIASSKGLHLYDHCWDVANIRLGKFEKK